MGGRGLPGLGVDGVDFDAKGRGGVESVFVGGGQGERVFVCDEVGEVGVCVGVCVCVWGEEAGPEGDGGKGGLELEVDDEFGFDGVAPAGEVSGGCVGVWVCE